LTTYNLEVWYRATNQVGSEPVGGVVMYFFTYASTDCTGVAGGPASTAVTYSPDTTGTWTRLAGQTTTDANVQSLQVLLAAGCNTVPCSFVVNFDDVSAETEPPLAVTVASFAARPVAQGVLVRWRTGTEADLLGFQVYRSRGHSWERITRSLIAAKGSVSGASYRYLDRTARRGIPYRYRIKAVRSDGTATWFGPVRVT
jgi:hypothetical protein